MVAGEFATLAIYAPGGPDEAPIGSLRVIILNASEHECDCIISPAELQVKDNSLYDTTELLNRAGLGLYEIQEGPVYVLRNMNTEWLA